MNSIRLAYKTDDFGNAIYARISWLKRSSQSLYAIALVYHAGGLIAGSSEIVPQIQIDTLCSSGFVTVMPNYRLIPQVTGRDAFEDGEEVFAWATTLLPQIMATSHDINLDIDRVVAMGHSSGGTIALHLASIGKPLKAVLALYPFIFVSDLSTNAHQPATIPQFANAPPYVPTEEDWAVIKPAGQQLSEAPLTQTPTPRNRWLFELFRTAQWLQNVQPDGDLVAIDPMTRLRSDWPPVMLVHGSEDNLSGRSVELMLRAEREMKAVGIEEVRVEIVQDEGHLFDHALSVGTSDLGPKWMAVRNGLQWLRQHT